MNPVRIGANVFVLFSILWAPFWFSIVVLVCAAWYFEEYWEIICFGFLYDLLYGVRDTAPYLIHGTFGFVSALTVFIVFQYLKKYTRSAV